MQSAMAFLYLLVLSFGTFGSVQLQTCEPITIPQCKSMPYNMTHFPNDYKHTRQMDAKQFLKQYEYDIILQRNCSELLVFYLCAKIVPICWENQGLSQEPVKPCKSVCQKVRQDCMPTIRSLLRNKTLPKEFESDHDCSKLPEYETGVCIDPKSFIHTVAPPENQCERKCNCCTQIDFMKYKENKFDHYAYRARLKQIAVNSDGSTDLTIKVLRNVLSLGSRSPRFSQETIRSRCERVNLVTGKVYLFAGHVDTATNQKVLGCVKPWSRRLRTEMRKINKQIKDA